MSGKETNKNLLFVCYGNICRSPMAEGQAKKMLGNKVNIESAGLAPYFESAAEEAVEVLKNFYGINISNHEGNGVKSLILNQSSFPRRRESSRIINLFISVFLIFIFFYY